MKVNRRSLLKTTFFIPLSSWVGSSVAQSSRGKTLNIVVPASAGTSIDVTARFFSEPLSQKMNRPIAVDNKPGTGGLAAYVGFATNPADPNTLMVAGIPMYLLPLLSQGTKTFNPIDDLTPVTRVARVSFGLVVAAESPYKSVKDLIIAMKDRPDQLTYSSQGVGSAAHLCGALLTHMSNTRAQHVPYKSTSTATTDVAAGLVTFTMQPGPSVLNLLQSGKLRLLAVSGIQRWEAYPDTPTISESGIPGYEMSSWLDFIARKGTPAKAVALLDNQIREIALTKEYKSFCSKQMIFPESVNHIELEQQMKTEADKWQRIVKLIQ